MGETPSTPKPTDSSSRYGGALAAVAKRHEEIRADKTKCLMVPGYEGIMKVQYRLLPEVEMDRLGKRIEEVKRSEGVKGAWKVEADTLVQMCDRILMREPGQDEWTVLEDDNGPIRYEGRLAAVLGQAGVKVEGARATDIVLDFFSPREDPGNPSSARVYPNAMERHTNAIFQWNRGESEKIDRELLGE